MKPLKHFAPDYILAPTHPITITLVGAGGTGSQVLHGLARIDYALRALGHPGLAVVVYDGDQVSAANIGRQLFSENEIGQNKAVLLVGRINRFFGKNWHAKPVYFTEKTFDPKKHCTNFLITCVDTVKARKGIYEMFNAPVHRGYHPYSNIYYWMDYGNSRNTGQIVLGTFGELQQPAGDTYETVGKLPNIFELFPAFEGVIDEDTGPSCSVLEALTRQDLMINTILANYGTDMLFRLFREGSLKHQGIFLNLQEVITSKIPLKAKKKEPAPVG